jgi:hypothetical protein
MLVILVEVHPLGCVRHGLLHILRRPRPHQLIPMRKIWRVGVFETCLLPSEALDRLTPAEHVSELSQPPHGYLLSSSYERPGGAQGNPTHTAQQISMLLIPPPHLSSSLGTA